MRPTAPNLHTGRMLFIIYRICLMQIHKDIRTSPDIVLYSTPQPNPHTLVGCVCILINMSIINVCMLFGELTHYIHYYTERTLRMFVFGMSTFSGRMLFCRRVQALRLLYAHTVQIGANTFRHTNMTA